MTWTVRIALFLAMLLCFSVVGFVFCDFFVFAPAPLPEPFTPGALRNIMLSAIELVAAGIALLIGGFLFILLICATEASVEPELTITSETTEETVSDGKVVTVTTIRKETTCPASNQPPTP